jgi:hypothetical protein
VRAVGRWPGPGPLTGAGTVDRVRRPGPIPLTGADPAAVAVAAI